MTELSAIPTERHPAVRWPTGSTPTSCQRSKSVAATLRRSSRRGCPGLEHEVPLDELYDSVIPAAGP